MTPSLPPLRKAQGRVHCRRSRYLASLMALVMVNAACNQSVDNRDGMFELGGSYTWRGQILDSLTGNLVSRIGIRVREQPEHEAAGWAPIPVAQLDNGSFYFEYDLAGPVCAPQRDTTLVVHLEFSDSLRRYQTTVRTSVWPIDYCDGIPPPTPIKPFPSEDGLRVLMQP